MRNLSDGSIPDPVLEESSGIIWEKLVKNNKKKVLTERAFGNLFVQLDILNVCTIVM